MTFNASLTSNGWTNYTPCIMPETMILLSKLANKTEEEFQVRSNMPSSIIPLSPRFTQTEPAYNKLSK